MGLAVFSDIHGNLLYPDRDPVKLGFFRRAGFPWREREPLSLKTALAEIDEPFLVYGYTHISWQQSEDGKPAINPGSVSAASERDALAHYALVTWNHGTWQAEHRAIRYHLARLNDAFHDSGLLEAGGVMARCILMSCETGENVVWHFIEHARQVTDAAGYREYAVFPDEMLDQAEATFDRGRY